MVWEEGFWVLSEKLGFVSGLVWNAAVVSGLCTDTHWLYSRIGNGWSINGSKTSPTISWHGNLNFRRFIYFLSGFCFGSEFYFRNDISSTTFPCAWPGDHGRGRFARLTSLERVTTGVGSVSRAARAKHNSLGRSVRPTLRVGKPFPWLYPKIRLNYHSLYLRSTGQTTGVSG